MKTSLMIVLLMFGCGDDSERSLDFAMTAPDMSAQLDASEDMAAVDLRSTDTAEIDLQSTDMAILFSAVSPEEAWVDGTSPFLAAPPIAFVDQQGTVYTAANDGSYGISPGTMVALVTQATSTLLPSLNSAFTAWPYMENASTGDSLEVWFNGSGGKPSASVAVTNAGGPDQPAQLAAGACVVDVLESHNAGVALPQSATITATSGYSVYALTFDSSHQSAALSNDGGITGRFFIMKSGATGVQQVAVQATAKTGSLTYASQSCTIVPNAISQLQVLPN